MITVLKNGENYKVFAGKSTDSKPSGCGNGSQFIEVDTGYEYVYDAEGDAWTKMGSGGSPIQHGYLMAVEAKTGFNGYATGDVLDPDDFDINIYDIAYSPSRLVDTIKDSVKTSLIWSGDMTSLYYRDTDNGIMLTFGLMDSNEEYTFANPIAKAGNSMVISTLRPLSGTYPVSVPASWLNNGTEDIALNQGGAYGIADIIVSVGTPVYSLAAVTPKSFTAGGSMKLGDFDIRFLDGDGVMANAIATSEFDGEQYTEEGYCAQAYISDASATVRLYLMDSNGEFASVQTLVAGEYTARIVAFTAGQTAYPVTFPPEVLAETTSDSISLVNQALATAYITVTVAAGT